LLALSALALGGCSRSTFGPDALAASADELMRIEGLPASQRIRTGENLLLSLTNVTPEVESIRWFSSNPRVLSLAATPAVSPCGSACAWLRGEASGSARVEALVCFVDGACQSVRRARIVAPDGTSSDIEAALDVML
jgi:hypothetical protein